MFRGGNCGHLAVAALRTVQVEGRPVPGCSGTSSMGWFPISNQFRSFRRTGIAAGPIFEEQIIVHFDGFSQVCVVVLIRQPSLGAPVLSTVTHGSPSKAQIPPARSARRGTPPKSVAVHGDLHIPVYPGPQVTVTLPNHLPEYLPAPSPPGPAVPGFCHCRTVFRWPQ